MMMRSAKKNKKQSGPNEKQQRGQQNKEKIKADEGRVKTDEEKTPEAKTGEAVKMDINKTFFVPFDEIEEPEKKTESEQHVGLRGARTEVTIHHDAKYSNISAEMSNNNELSEVLKLLATKITQNDSSKNNIPIESFSKVVPEFDGVSIPIQQWIKCFDENADAYELTDKQKYVNARIKIKGTAKLFLETTTVSDYHTLIGLLLDEFDKTLTSAEVHKQLSERKKHENENFHEYVLNMRKIAALGCVDDYDKISSGPQTSSEKV
ncbi:uncharacterized protein LOC121405119 [Drosophila obscura]|uniref:uncharacterized protein LOC121405119 n=1 Tax=Drosophila obscura TaxID=7282 RepID=UPI001BB2C4CE|nr:uncharacterized protein LOC121405119 [Drosophila obscura]